VIRTPYKIVWLKNYLKIEKTRDMLWLAIGAREADLQIVASGCRAPGEHDRQAEQS
jgi:hypothetical protein